LEIFAEQVSKWTLGAEKVQKSPEKLYIGHEKIQKLDTGAGKVLKLDIGAEKNSKIGHCC